MYYYILCNVLAVPFLPKIVVLETKIIKNNYIKTWFIPDLVAVIPVDYMILISEVSANYLFMTLNLEFR